MGTKGKKCEEVTPPNPLLELDSVYADILHHILRILNLPLLKTARLVSKSWNEVACSILRKISAVPLNASKDDSEDFEKFKDTLLDRQAFFPPEWPNPFQNYKLLAASSTNQSLIRFVQRPSLSITALEIVHDKEFEADSFGDILEQYKGGIVNLTIISGNSEPSPFLTLSSKQAEGWKSLKSIFLTDSCGAGRQPCPHMSFITVLTGTTRVQELRLDGHLPNITSALSQNSSDCWEKLARLDLKSERVPANATPEEIQGFMKWAQELKFPSLTRLMLWISSNESVSQTSEKYAPYVLPLIHESCGTLEDLQLPFLPLASIPSSPKLKCLCSAFMDGDKISDVSERKFPALTSLQARLYWTEAPDYTNPNDSIAHKKITYFTVSSLVSAPMGAVETLWPSLRDHCPNLSAICIQTVTTSSTLNAIRKRLPRLQDINILTQISTTELLGTNCGQELTAKGWPCEDIENSALMEMAELTHLRLSKSVKLSRAVITTCLGKLPKIKLLSFFWDDTLEPADVLEHLGHIQDVFIYYVGKLQRQKLEKLAKTMKGLRVRKQVDWFLSS